MQLNSVVLPEPFGPIRPQISPRPTVNDTPSSATTPPNRMATLLMDSNGSSPDLPAPRCSLASFIARRVDLRRFCRRPEVGHLAALNEPATNGRSAHSR